MSKSSSVKTSNKINYDFPDLVWLKDPAHNKVIHFPFKIGENAFRLLDKTTRMPAYDRHFCPCKGVSDEAK